MDGFTCTCKVGFKGNLCNILDRCHPNPCHSNGICTETYHGVQCECSPGFKGKLCEMESKCEPINPCLNGGACREYFDHYHCSCPQSFQGQNCEDYISPTKAPPTVPQKLVGPQVIPAPFNAPAFDTHDLYTFHSYDEFGKPLSIYSHVKHKGESQGIINPGANLVPSSGYLKVMDHHHHGPIPFIGAPGATLHEGIIFHKEGEDEKKPSKDKEETVNNLPDNTKDDRYQTHVVEVSKDKDGNSLQHPNLNNGYHIGEPLTLADIKENPPSADNKEESEKVVSDHKEHLEEMKENSHHHQHDEHKTNEMHEPVNKVEKHPHVIVPEHHHLVADEGEGEQKVIVEENASERSLLSRKPAELASTRDMVSENGNNKSGIDKDDDAKKNIKTIADLLKMFDKATKTLTSKIIKNTNKFMRLQGRQPFNPNAIHENDGVARNSQPTSSQTATGSTDGQSFVSEVRPDSTVSGISNYIQNIYNLTSAITGNLAHSANVLGAKKNELIRQLNYKNFTDHQKNAYKTWRRQALINFHARNPDKPIPRNTVSLSKNSLCPKFCRLFCDPWCVKIGCCHLSEDKLQLYRKIENEQSKLQQKSELYTDNKQPVDGITVINHTTGQTKMTMTCAKCNENADCIDGKCQCKAGFDGNGEACTVDTCLLCHVNANCQNERCFCKSGYEGDGYDCQLSTNKRQSCPKCHKKAECISSHCMCVSGFYGNGKHCWPLPIL